VAFPDFLPQLHDRHIGLRLDLPRMKSACASMRRDLRSPPIFIGATSPVVSTRLAQRTAVAGPYKTAPRPDGKTFARDRLHHRLAEYPSTTS